MKIIVFLWLAVLLQVDILLAGPVSVVSEDNTEKKVRNLELSGNEINVEEKDEEYINSKLPKEMRDRLYGGDILLTPKQREIITEMERQQELEGGIEKRAVVKFERDLWPNAVVPYVISSSLGSAARSAINAAIAEYERKTCIDFVPRTTQRDYIFFFQDSGCYSYIGRTGRGQQISIGRGCERTGIVIHEIFHALGRWHEQSRPDRDSYIRVNFNNIRSRTESNFEKLTFSEASTNNIGYDYKSLMHYSAYAFSRNGRPTIEPLSSQVSLRDLGQRNSLTNEDLQHALNLYCGGQSVTTGSWSAWRSWSPCSVTCGGGTQTRNRVCLGGNNCPGSSTETRNCNINTQCPRWSSWSSWSTCSVTCGTGQQQRTRSCLGTGCSGSSTDRRACSLTACPGVWTQWSDWDSCSEECGAGTQTRTRNCVGGVCSGDNTQERTCVEMPLCLRVAQWGPWSSWSQCSELCGFRGTQMRTRTCSSNSAACVGSGREVRKCNHGSCPSQLGNSDGWGPWRAWGRCSRRCGTGYQLRRRTCESRPCFGLTIQIQGCNYDNCATPEPPQPIVVAPSEEAFTASDYTALSCREVNIQTGIPELHTLNEEPLTADIVQGCVDLASASGFRFVGVIGGYCISGSNTESQYTQLAASTSCTGGTGSFTSTSLLAHMNVYSITPA